MEDHKTLAARVLFKGTALREAADRLTNACNAAAKLSNVLLARKLAEIDVNFSVQGHGVPDASGRFALPAADVMAAMERKVVEARAELDALAWQAPGAPHPTPTEEPAR